MKVLLLVTVLLLAGCGAESSPSDDSASDGASSRLPMPDSIPAAPGEVTTRGVVTVMDNGRPEVCLGPVAESWPPQCSGPPLVGWSWRTQRLVLGQPSAPTHQRQGAVRWGQYALTGQWDGTSLTLRTAVPAALHDAAATPEAPVPPAPERDHTAAELEDIAEELGRRLPGALTSYADRRHVFVDVTYDDGSLQDWCDRTYGARVVVVTSALIDV